MAKDRVFFSRLADVHPRFGTPAFAIIVSSAWAILLAATGTFEQLLTYVVFAGWIFYALGAASIFVYRRTRPAESSIHRSALPFTPLLFILAAAAIVLNTIVSQPGRAASACQSSSLACPCIGCGTPDRRVNERTAGHDESIATAARRWRQSRS